MIISRFAVTTGSAAMRRWPSGSARAPAWRCNGSTAATSERLTGALLDRLTHHVSILTMNSDSYRLKQSAGRRRAAARAEQDQASDEIADPDTGEIPTT